MRLSDFRARARALHQGKELRAIRHPDPAHRLTAEARAVTSMARASRLGQSMASAA